MFWIFKRKVNEANVKAFSSAIKAIKIYTEIFEFEKAKKWIQEILFKEKKSLEDYLNSTKDSENKKAKEKKEFDKKNQILKKLSQEVNDLEKKYNEKIEKERFQVRFKWIETEINNLLWQSKTNEAMILLNSFYEENKDKIIVINFYKKQKAIIQKVIDKKIWRLEDRTKVNAKLEAMNLIWEKYKEEKKEIEIQKTKNFFERIKEKIKEWKKIQEKKWEKKLLDEISILIEENNKIKKSLAEKKLEKIHSGLIKELHFENMIWFDLYWKILWADKISGDTFGIEENKNNYLMFLWDATGHWVKAWFIISVFNKVFSSLKDKKISEIFFEINNQLKQTLESRNFVTWALFEINKETAHINYAWMWHEPILIYRAKERKVEVKVLWWLAAWIRIIKNMDQVKIKELTLEDDDILMIFSDWIVETKWLNWNFYWIESLKKSFEVIARTEKNIRNIYNMLIQELTTFKWWTKFLDDASILLLKREKERDLIKIWDILLKEIAEKEKLKKEEIKKLEWESRKEINKKLEEIRRQKETQRIIKVLWDLYYSWEILQLKQEAIRYIKEWYIDKKINNYLKKALENENKYKIEQKNIKMQNKYNVLIWLYKKWDYDTVIKEVEDIILKDWNF